MIDVLLVCSPGGHLVEMAPISKLVSSLNLSSLYAIHDFNEPEIDSCPVIKVPNATRDFRLVNSFFAAFKLIRWCRPKVIISTGGGIALPFFLVGKIFRCKLVYVESPTRIYNPSLTAKLVCPFADVLLVRYASLVGSLAGSVFPGKR